MDTTVILILTETPGLDPAMSQNALLKKLLAKSNAAAAAAAAGHTTPQSDNSEVQFILKNHLFCTVQFLLNKPEMAFLRRQEFIQISL